MEGTQLRVREENNGQELSAQTALEVCPVTRVGGAPCVAIRRPLDMDPWGHPVEAVIAMLSLQEKV